MAWKRVYCSHCGYHGLPARMIVRLDGQPHGVICGRCERESPAPYEDMDAPAKWWQFWRFI
jgi:RNase P subunit RPR2